MCFVEYVEGTIGNPRITDDSLSTLTLSQDYAKFSIRLSQIPFRLIGSLTPNMSGENPGVGPFINRDHNLDQPPYFHGPFTTLAERYTAWIDDKLESILHKETWVNDRLGRYLIQLELRDLIQHDPDCQKPVEAAYIKHGDASGNNFMLDSEGHLLAIFDWEK